MKLMIVDDNQEVRIFLRSLLKNKCEEIIECSDGNEAIETFEKFKPDYVLMDIEIPGTDGLKSSEKIISKHRDAKIIIVTSHTDSHYQIAAKKMGAIAFISKDNLIEIEEIISKY
jgi:DNA-binding NarL/FixJ family response regulator